MQISQEYRPCLHGVTNVSSCHRDHENPDFTKMVPFQIHTSTTVLI